MSIHFRFSNFILYSGAIWRILIISVTAGYMFYFANNGSRTALLFTFHCDRRIVDRDPPSASS